MIPLRDDQPRTTRPYVTYSIMVLNLAVFAYEIWISMQGRQAWDAFLVRYSEIPHHFQLAFQGSQYTISGAFLTIFTSMFIHAGWLHVLGNMWFLWIFGDNVEDYLGHTLYLTLYLVCWIAAALLHTLFNLGSAVPSVGASGAIAAVMGAFIVIYPRDEIKTVFFILLFVRVTYIPAVVLIGIWFLLQLFSAGQVAQHVQTGGVAYLAHVGGFLFGVLTGRLWRR